jgi:dipeptidyl aminopeptidase/acylaminoacyl peptidase
MLRPVLFASIMLFSLFSCASAEELAYQKPPKVIAEAINAPPPPTISVSPTHDYAVLLSAVAHPSIAELAEPWERLAGLRIDIHTNGPHLLPHNISYKLIKLSNGSELPVSLPPGNRKLSVPIWSPDGKHFVFTNTTANSIDLWVVDAATGKGHQIPGVKVNAVISESDGGPRRTRPPLDWLPDGRTVLVREVVANRGKAPAEPTVPVGPHVQQSSGHSGPVRTYEDMLSTPHDEALFDYYATAQLAYVDIVSGKSTPTGKPGIFSATELSPDGKDLLVSVIHKPYSYLHPYQQFPTNVEVWNHSGAKLYTLASLPLADRVPIEGVRVGPRSYRWLPGQGASLVWVEAMDGGNPKEKASYRDHILSLSAPFKGEPVEMAKIQQRFRGFEPLEDGGLALVEDYDHNKRWLRTFSIDLKHPGSPSKLLFERNQQDRYKDQGEPVMQVTPNGQVAVRQTGDNIFLEGLGASAQGDHPFLDRFNLATGKTERIFRSGNDGYETVEAVLDDSGDRLLVRRESPTEPPNYFIRTGNEMKQISHYVDPMPELRRVKKELVKYKREDGVDLSFTLYLPPDYKPGTKLPTFIWAYPYEYNDAGTAGEISGSTQRFTQLNGHLLMAMAGYAVLENAGMPVIGTPETVNNTYLEQIVMDAKAAINKASEMGVTDPERVAVGGHSYGAFMTGNLLAHSNLFHAGIAESGAYNRTLTPFGFQSERRTLWEAPDLYVKMSPLMSANHIKTPMLLIHGEADDNTGTFPINSERLYQAIRGNGGTVRLVMLPLEAHGYASQETLEHVLWEELTWLDKYLKPGGGSMETKTLQ